MSLSNKIFAIGDIHGCDLELKELISQLPLDKDSTLVFLGDYVDRGPNSKGVIDQIIELQQQFKVVTLMGNHESMLLEFITDPSSSLAGFFVLNGGSATLASYVTQGTEYEIPSSHLEFYKNLKLYHETKDHFFVHAGVPNVALNDLDPIHHFNDLLWIRRPFFESQFPWKKKIIHGHTPVSEVEQTEKRINVDTGCVFNGSLSAIEVNSGEVFSVRAKRAIPKTFLKANPQISRVAARFSGTIPVFIEDQGHYSEFLTINYNEFGMLILEQGATEKLFQVGQILKGKIGSPQQQQIDFVGQVVRHQKRQQEIAYGIKMLEPLKFSN